METTKLMSAMVSLPDRHHPAPVRVLNDSAPSAEQRQPVAEDGRNIPPSGKPEAGNTVSREDLNTAVSRLSDYVQSIRRTLDFSVDEDTGRTIITVMDAKTERVIRQIPPEEVLNMLDHIASVNKEGRHDPQGLFVQEKA
jgi:flagellar protein FlaG